MILIFLIRHILPMKQLTSGKLTSSQLAKVDGFKKKNHCGTFIPNY